MKFLWILAASIAFVAAAPKAEYEDEDSLRCRKVQQVCVQDPTELFNLNRSCQCFVPGEELDGSDVSKALVTSSDMLVVLMNLGLQKRSL